MIIRRAASEHEIDQALDAYLANEPRIPASERPPVLAHWLVMFASCPEGFWIAQDEASRQIVGVASAMLRPPQWMLTNFYVLPEYHGQGIGRQLMAQAYATRAGCERFLVHASGHPSAQGLYMQYGMYPLPYSIVFKGHPGRPVAPRALVAEACPVSNILSTLDEFDLQALGFIRPEFHQRWGQLGPYFLVREGERAVGYFRASSDGMLGPLVVSDERWMVPVLEWAIHQQEQLSSGPHEVFVPGANWSAVAHLVSLGYHYSDHSLLLSSHPMPGLARVIFHDTDLL